jgi:hypothetical protein
MDGWMFGWVSGMLGGLMDGCLDAWTYGVMNGGKMDEWMYERLIK